MGVLNALSFALDAVEKEVTGAKEGHGKRVAWLTYCLSRGLNLSDGERADLIACAILHDNAIAEYSRDMQDLKYRGIHSQKFDKYKEISEIKGIHALMGEENIQSLPFYADVRGVISQHHENADGSGPLHKREAEIDFRAELIHLADWFDLRSSLMRMDDSRFERMRQEVRKNCGRIFSHRVVAQMDDCLSFDDILALQEEGTAGVLQKNVPAYRNQFNDSEIEGIAEFFSGIVDVKSSFTKDHSLGVALKAKTMAEHYHFPHDKMMRFYFAGAMHDIGKMIISNDILEKPGKLDADEFQNMQNHAVWTYRILSQIDGLADITEWAANHHEKLDGTGYPRSLRADQLTLEDRLMACIDIYQALTELRPYKEGLSHATTMRIMRSMVSDGKIDADITEEIDKVFGDGISSGDAAPGTGTGKKWKCPVCGYIYEGEEPPKNCPVCGASGDRFTLI